MEAKSPGYRRKNLVPTIGLTIAEKILAAHKDRDAISRRKFITERERLKAVAQLSGVELPLAEVALLMAAEEYPARHPGWLAVVYLKVGWRLCLPMYGVGKPGHFLVGCETDGEPLFVGAFPGVALTKAGCRICFGRMTGGSVPFRKDYLAPSRARYLLVSIPRNLKGICLRMEDLDRNGRGCRADLAPRPGPDRGCVGSWAHLVPLGKLADARSLLEQYLTSIPKEASN